MRASAQSVVPCPGPPDSGSPRASDARPTVLVQLFPFGAGGAHGSEYPRFRPVMGVRPVPGITGAAAAGRHAAPDPAHDGARARDQEPAHDERGDGLGEGAARAPAHAHGATAHEATAHEAAPAGAVADGTRALRSIGGSFDGVTSGHGDRAPASP
ncbi:hypothetical protein GCM10010448_05380 [Streptomyces glomeratus]|uniref:Uncharacterized protein n=1 Tax=Streptomyces glomeratus TaxID=284452 RepID=A0ABP6KXL9_9ACTN